jgi:Tol biopolymer transport system component
MLSQPSRMFRSVTKSQDLKQQMRIIGLALLTLLLSSPSIGRLRNRASVPSFQSATGPRTILFTVTEETCGAGRLPCIFTQNIWTIKSDGSDARQLTMVTKKGNVCSTSGWSPDGSHVVFGCTGDPLGGNASGNILHFWTINADGSDAKPLPDGWYHSWSPDGQKLAYVSSRPLDGGQNEREPISGNVWVMNADGSRAAPLTWLTNNMITTRAVLWSPDGSKLAFLSNRALNGSNRKNTKEGVFNIWLMNADGSKAMPLTRFTVAGINILNVIWAPDGGRLAFLSNCALDGSDARAANIATNIWTVNADGSSIKTLTRFQRVDIGALDWSPNGSRVVFSSNGALDGSDAGNQHFARNIWIMKADGSTEFPLTRSAAWGGDNTNPLWSPDGSLISFASTRPQGGSTRSATNVWVMKADGSGAVALTHFMDRSAVATAWHP